MRRAGFFFLLACACSEYTPGELLGSPNARTYGCVDVAVAPYFSSETPPGGTMIEVALGNRCDHGVETHFERLRVEMEQGGALFGASPYDPHHEIRPARLPPSARVTERIIFFPGAPPCDDIRSLCVDTSELIDEPSSRGPNEQGRVCFTEGR